ncbi:hypothetical protein Taro_049196, partial [Colocasia esculenta]|nr:hypothetical protein [Colocasia esculenta]
MRCPAADKVVFAAYQLRGFTLEWWRLKMQTTFAGRTEEAITWSEFLDVFNDTFFPIQVQQVKREQIWTLQQGNSSVLEYQMRFMALSRYAPYVVSDNNMMVEYFIRGLRVELQDAIVPLMCKTVEEAAQRAATLERSIRTRQKLKQAFKGKGRGWGGRQQFQQGRGRPEVEESQQSTARQSITPPGYRCYNCNQPGHLIHNCPYSREYGYGRGVQQQQQPQQFPQPQSEISGMADRRDWGGGADDPEESTQRMIERIWESLTDIRARMDQQAPVPPVAVPPGDGETVPVAPVPPRVEVPFAAPVPPPPPVLIAEEPVMLVEKFMRLQLPTYSGGPNPDTVEHWVHEIERIFATMRCPAADKVVLAACQLRGFALEWWRLKMQTTFAGRTEEAINWSEFLDVFNDTFFPIQVQQVKRKQFRTLQQGSGSFRLPQQLVGASKGKAPAGPSSSGFGKWGQKLKQAFKGKGRGWGGRQQFQQGRGRPEVEESQQSTARQPVTPPGYRCYN